MAGTGGSIAIAHIRGGGELGPAWHEGGRGAHKINSIADFISCADYLVAHRYTKPAKLVISGQSAGGITIGMALMKRPELFAAAAIDVGMLNMTRLDQIPIGPMNFQEFGSPELGRECGICWQLMPIVICNREFAIQPCC